MAESVTTLKQKQPDRKAMLARLREVVGQLRGARSELVDLREKVDGWFKASEQKTAQETGLLNAQLSTLDRQITTLTRTQVPLLTQRDQVGEAVKVITKRNADAVDAQSKPDRKRMEELEDSIPDLAEQVATAAGVDLEEQVPDQEQDAPDGG